MSTTSKHHTRFLKKHPRRRQPANPFVNSVTLILSIVLLSVATALPTRASSLDDWRHKNKVWRGVQLAIRHDQAAEELISILPQLAASGINVLVLELDYNFAFDSDPQLRLNTAVTKREAAKLAAACREKGIRPIPLMNCLGHQSWAKVTFPLLLRHPELDETPGQFPNNEGIYCRSWCPQHPDLPRIVFPLIDEIIDAFQADAFHCGMDEVFLLASEHCPRCRGGDPAKLFAKSINDLHDHIVRRRGLEMLIWSDRLLDGKKTGYGKWEAAENGTAPAIDQVPKDLILCDWHYEKRTEYPSIPLFLEKGFRVWPGGWKNPEATRALIAYAQQHRNERLLGHLCTTWSAVKTAELPEWPPIRAALQMWRE